MPLFAMSGDGKSEVSIPMLFLFHHEGAKLLEAMAADTDMWIRLGHKAINYEEVNNILTSLHIDVGNIQVTSQPITKTIPAASVESENTPTKRRSVIDDIEQTRSMLQDLMKKMNVGGDVNVRVRSKTPGSAESDGQTAKGPDNIQQVGASKVLSCNCSLL